jgi:hypothetical protein
MMFSALLFSIVLTSSIGSLDQSRKVLIKWYDIDSESTLLPRKYEDYISQEPAPSNKVNSNKRPGIAPWRPQVLRGGASAGFCPNQMKPFPDSTLPGHFPAPVSSFSDAPFIFEAGVLTRDSIFIADIIAKGRHSPVVDF